MSEQAHEDYSHFGKTHELPSNRSFGWVFTGFFGLTAIWPLLRNHGGVRWWAAVVSGIFLVLTLVIPDVLEPLNRLWMKLALLLARVVNPVILGLMFFLIFTPVAFVLRLLGKDLLRLKLDQSASSYWLTRADHGPAGPTMKNQF